MSSEPRTSLELRARVAERLRGRRAEIEQATLVRVHAVCDNGRADDPEYRAGLREAVRTGVAYGIAGIETGAERSPVPVQLLAQVRAAARNGVSLDTVMRRYFAGYTLLGDFVIDEAERSCPISGTALRRVLRAKASLFDCLLVAISDEYAREIQARVRTTEQRRAEQVRMLLAGNLVETVSLGYELDAWHVGVVAAGPGTRAAVRDLATALDRRLLVVHADAGTVWAWFGGSRKLSAREVSRLARGHLPAEAALTLGEPGHGMEGWRLTHRQAKAAIPIARRGASKLLHYSDVALPASALGDEVLVHTLRQAYLAPLECEADGGVLALRTLAAYFTSGRNVSSAATALGVSRKTVGNRLRAVEERIEQSLDGCAAELETALRLRELGSGVAGVQ